MLEIPYWIEVHKILIKYKQLILNLFIVAYVVGYSLISFSFLLYLKFPLIFSIISDLASSIGTISLILFLTTLMPGIFYRFKIFPLFGASLKLFRRQIGVLMFISALIHSFYLITVPAIMTSQFTLEFLTSREILGSLSLMILFPVWLTSNNFSKAKLGRFWKIVQRLTYLALAVIYFHVAFASEKWALVTMMVFILEISSWVKFKLFDKKSIESPK
ncbi:ferric reductase-like transmembrane domain-containing protein [Candidatus Woesebacteria bacterium]|nr:ferric reductase-like transmembrane domain-containing protein [Candidatus Woesebacteria bacterium]